jgi:predicted small secreted protein
LTNTRDFGLHPDKKSKGSKVVTAMIKKIGVAVFLIALASTILTGCNTIRGLGKDIEKTGEVIQRTGK